MAAAEVDLFLFVNNENLDVSNVRGSGKCARQRHVQLKIIF